MNEILRGALIPTLISATMAALSWAGLFTWSVAATVYRDHEYLVSFIPKARQEQASEDQAAIDSLKKRVDEVQRLGPKVKPQCWMQNITLPPPRTIPTVASANETIFFCNTERKAPLFMWVDYDEQPLSVGPVLFPQGRQVSMEQSLRGNQIFVHIESPSILPYQMFIVTAYGATEKPPTATKIQLNPINPER